jgi:ERCC4-type nuclease
MGQHSLENEKPGRDCQALFFPPPPILPVGLSQNQKALPGCVEMPPARVVVDSGEQGSRVVKALEEQGVEIVITTLEAGDYVADHKIAFERVTLEDILKSIFEDRKLLSQIKDLANNYERPVLIIEGEDPFFSGRTINPASIQGFLDKIVVPFKVPLLYTLNEAETAGVILSMARSEQPDEI